MGKILVLDELTTCKIAAGEVVERPASVVKEMAENAIDAGATKISVEIKNGGIKYIKIDDNGSGFEPDDVIIAFDKHATSKIRSADDLFNIGTLGFRGEALASIASVSELELRTKQKDNDEGVFVKFSGGNLIDSGVCGCKDGSTFEVRNLFFNTPARFKFLKKDITEAGYVADVLQKLALSHPDVSIKLVSDGKLIMQTPGNNDLMSCIHSLFGKQISSFIRPVSYEAGTIKVTGFAGVREAAYGNRNRQYSFVNGRFVKSKTITSAIDEAYKTITMKGKFPFIVLDIKVNPTTIDVNVHPTKIEVRFSDEGAVFRSVYHGLQNALFGEPERESFSQGFGGIYVKDEEQKSVSQNDENSESNTNAHHNANIQNSASLQNSSAGYVPGSSFSKANDKPFKKDMSEAVSASYVSIFDTAREMAEKTPVNVPPAPVVETKTSTESETKPLTEVEPAIGEIYGDNDIYVNSTVVGQLFDTYIVLEYRDQLVLLDQHAAHERLMYEKIKKSLEENDIESQLLLVPVAIQLAPSEYAAFKANTEFFTKAGFEIEEFGMNTINVRSVPMILAGQDIEAFIVSGIRMAAQSKERVSLFSDNAVYTMACKAAIKANRKLRTEEIDALLSDLAAVKNPGTCPHGRPITVKYTKYEIERKFHRC